LDWILYDVLCIARVVMHGQCDGWWLEYC